MFDPPQLRLHPASDRALRSYIYKRQSSPKITQQLEIFLFPPRSRKKKNPESLSEWHFWPSSSCVKDLSADRFFLHRKTREQKHFWAQTAKPLDQMLASQSPNESQRKSAVCTRRRHTSLRHCTLTTGFVQCATVTAAHKQQLCSAVLY